MALPLKEEFKSFRRTWVHHTGMQMATLTVLAATFTVVTFVLAWSLNFRRVLSEWGDSQQMTVYLQETTPVEKYEIIRSSLEALPNIKSVNLISKEQATDLFKVQMANYAPDLLQDKEFSHPFPASFQLAFRESVHSENDAQRLAALAAQIRAVSGVEDVSYGQSWLKNYASFVEGVDQAGWFIMAVLIAGSILVIGNSVSASISSRRDEIEILELVGATSRSIRLPFVFEGAALGFMAAAVSLGANFLIYRSAEQLVQKSLSFSRLVSVIHFLNPAAIVAVLGGGLLFGALGAYVSVRRLNDGWAAAGQDAE
jgi:cell division transport system permease protein